MSFISAYIISSQMPQCNGGNKSLSNNFLTNGQNFKITSLPACLGACLGAPNDMSLNTPSATSHQQSTLSILMEKEVCLCCHRWFSRMEQHLAYNHKE
jgi:hypothetical protein